MRFNFSTARRGKCLIEVSSSREGPIATIWCADKQSEPGTSYAGTAELRAQVGNILTASQIEKIARIAILKFDTFGEFPGKTDVFWGDHEWRGELIPLS